MKKLITSVGFFGAAMAVIPAHAAVIVLDFENISPIYPFTNDVFVQDYYNGGMSSAGTSGPDLGVAFSSNSLNICLNSLDAFCSNTSRGGLAPASAQGGLFFLTGDNSIMNVTAGFEDGFSFNYVSATQPGSVSVFDGLDGTGSLLATLELLPNAGSCPGYGAGFCPFSPIGVSFAGVARSVSFAGVANQIAFDDITFGSEVPGGAGPIPEPSTWAMLLLGFGAIGGVIRNRRKVAVRYAIA